MAPLTPPGTIELGQVALETLEKHQTRACLLANQDLLDVGDSLSQAYAVALKGEELAALYIRALLLGGAHTLD